MEIINRRHEEINLSRRTASISYINFSTSKSILFSVHAVRDLGLAEGLFVHFVNDGDLWFFYVNDDPDGFKLCEHPVKRNIFIYNAHLVNLFKSRMKMGALPIRFRLKKTGKTIKQYELIEIETAKAQIKLKTDKPADQ